MILFYTDVWEVYEMTYWLNVGLYTKLLLLITLKPTVKLSYVIEWSKESYKKVLILQVRIGLSNQMMHYGHNRTAYTTPLKMPPYRLVYGKACHLAIELQHKADCAKNRLNLDLHIAGAAKMLQFHELDWMSIASSLTTNITAFIIFNLHTIFNLFLSNNLLLWIKIFNNVQILVISYYVIPPTRHSLLQSTIRLIYLAG